MNWLTQLNTRFAPRKLSRPRIVLALLVALLADGLQIPLAVPPAPEIIDVLAMIATVTLLGFHLLLLPTFVLELVPIVDLAPTWTGCVIAVVALRQHARRTADQNKLPPPA